MPSRAIEFDLKTRSARDLDHAALAHAVDWGDADKIYWIHADRARDDELVRLSADLRLPEDITQALRDPPSLPGMLEGESNVLLNLEYWSPERADLGKEAAKLALFMTSKLVLTASHEDVPAVVHFERTCRRELRFAQSTGFILFLILDRLTDDFVTMLGPLDGRCERLSDDIHERFDAQANKKILDLKHQVLVMKRVVTSLRDILMRLSGRRIPVVTEACRESLQDIYDHAHVLVASIESLREMAASTLDSYMSVLAQRLNETMKVLTVFSAIIMPMTLVAGVYGMNFDWMPEIHWRFGYAWALVLMVVCGGGLVYFFRRRGWI
jgi:magnesium transporter